MGTVRLDSCTKLLNPKWYEGMMNSGYEGFGRSRTASRTRWGGAPRAGRWTTGSTRTPTRPSWRTRDAEAPDGRQPQLLQEDGGHLPRSQRPRLLGHLRGEPGAPTDALRRGRGP